MPLGAAPLPVAPLPVLLLPAGEPEVEVLPFGVLWAAAIPALTATRARWLGVACASAVQRSGQV